MHWRIYGFFPKVLILKGENMSFFIQVIKQKSPNIFPKLSKNPPKIEVWRPLEASWRRPGPSWASWGILGHLGWLHTAFRLGILAVLGASWGRLGVSLGASWGVSGRLRLDFLSKWGTIEPFHLE